MFRIALVTLVLLSAGFVHAKQPRRTIDLAICLDTSNSMDGLIDSAKQKLWAIVNDLALAKPAPKLRVALLSYGNNGYDKNAGWVRLDSGFTDDLDLVSEKLFGLTTNGGTEYVGRVLQGSLARLSWSQQKSALKIMVVAGNETADQDGEVSFRLMCRRAIERGIMVNSIYCGAATDPVAQSWKEVATLADGHFAAIDQHGSVTIATPFDDQLTALSRSLNKTYLPFGADGKRGWMNQKAQDDNAENMNRDAAAQRANAKATSFYNCRWCLVDATRNNQVKLEDVKVKDLPKAMQSMTLAQMKTYLNGVYEKRAGIQKQIRELQKKRQAYLAKALAEAKKKDAGSFDAEVRKAIRAQAKAKGYDW